MPGYFVDTSAPAKLYHWEVGSERMEALLEAPGARLILSQLSLIELESVFATKVRTGVIDQPALAQLRGRFYADLSRGRFAVALLARRHFQGAGALIRTYAVDHALRGIQAIQRAVVAAAAVGRIRAERRIAQLLAPQRPVDRVAQGGALGPLPA